MNNKICFIIPYFGKFPNYFNLFLNSCISNKDIDFIFFTDNQIDNNIIKNNKNIKYYKMSFTELKKMFEEKLNINIDIFSPYKLCDYRPAFGLIFSDYLKDYEFWGHCDVDLILGKISDFLNFDEMKKFDKIQKFGHFTLYKNNNEINNLFLEKKGNYISFKKAIQIPEPCFFDEQSIIKILKENGIKIYENGNYFDCKCKSPYLKSKKFKYRKDQVIIWKNGKLYQKFLNLKEENELMYIHLQKRKFKKCILNNENEYYISSNGFFDIDYDTKKIYKPNFQHCVNFYISALKKISVNNIKIKLIVKNHLNEKFLKVKKEV